mgnify:FL=1
MFVILQMVSRFLLWSPAYCFAITRVPDCLLQNFICRGNSTHQLVLAGFAKSIKQKRGLVRGYCSSLHYALNSSIPSSRARMNSSTYASPGNAFLSGNMCPYPALSTRDSAFSWSFRSSTANDKRVPSKSRNWWIPNHKISMPRSNGPQLTHRGADPICTRRDGGT